MSFNLKRNPIHQINPSPLIRTAVKSQGQRRHQKTRLNTRSSQKPKEQGANGFVKGSIAYHKYKKTISRQFYKICRPSISSTKPGVLYNNVDCVLMKYVAYFTPMA